MQSSSRSVPVGSDTQISTAGSRCHLWQRFLRHRQGHGDGGRCDRAASALAESIRGTARGIHPARMPGSRHRLEPEILTPNTPTLFCLLRRLPHASIARKRFACQPIGRASSPWPCDRNPSSGRVASSLDSEGCLKEATFEPFSTECRDTHVLARSKKSASRQGTLATSRMVKDITVWAGRYFVPC